MVKLIKFNKTSMIDGYHTNFGIESHIMEK